MVHDNRVKDSTRDNDVIQAFITFRRMEILKIPHPQVADGRFIHPARLLQDPSVYFLHTKITIH